MYSCSKKLFYKMVRISSSTIVFRRSLLYNKLVLALKPIKQKNLIIYVSLRILMKYTFKLKICIYSL